MLPSDFTFSQQCLQDYLDCPRRFYLRYFEKLEWPAIESEPVLEQEKLAELGHNFHLMVQQKLSGIPSELIESTISDLDLARWWREFESLELDLNNATFYVEETLVTSLNGFKLLAKYDLLFHQEDASFIIFDWKTSRAKPLRQTYASRAQTQVYPLVLVEAGSTLFGETINPEMVEMRYWFPQHPDQPLLFGYSMANHQRNVDSIYGLISEIASLSAPSDFFKTDEEKNCRFCRYRSLCERGIRAGEFDGEAAQDSIAENDPFDIDLDAL